VKYFSLDFKLKNMKKCPHCGENIYHKTITCSGCGKPVKLGKETLLAFYQLKAELSQEFFEENKKDLNILETRLINEYIKQL
jgi:hypothetical protein